MSDLDKSDYQFLSEILFRAIYMLPELYRFEDFESLQHIKRRIEDIFMKIEELR